ncbi:hypothetical protein CPB84DRAFT_1755012 [Gymnopilus junonius]|uniref:Uncharacterized protein n=1 Tax=Gymnopilus junonius TaxID=109634 RepID=A0A9P5N6V0_GYMJU|nr:hypothetical protein CPB84DRAFT_1755012 [Gymnopilus junonius]
MGKHWTTSKEQLEWLKLQIPDYHEAQKKKSVDRFFSHCQSAWFEAWPMRKTFFPDKPETDPLTHEEQEKLTSAVIERKKQIVWWFQWNGNPARHSDKKDVSQFISALNLDKKVHKSKQRKPQRVEIYQKLYADKVKAAVDQEAGKLGLTRGRDKMKIRRGISQFMLDAEAAEVNEKIDEELRKWEEEREKGLQANGEEEEKQERTAEDYQSAVVALPEVLKNALKACSDVTGWVIQVVAAGPYGADNGEIWRQEYYFGPKNTAGCTFKEAYADFDKNFYLPFSRHVHNCFPPDVRASRVVHKPGTDSENDVGTRIPEPSQMSQAQVAPEVEQSGETVPSETLTQANPAERPENDDEDDEDDEESLAILVASLRKDGSRNGMSTPSPAIFSTQAEISDGSQNGTSAPSPYAIFSAQAETSPVSGSIFGTSDQQTPPPEAITTHTPGVTSNTANAIEVTISSRDVGGPSEPIEYAFARMRGEELPPITAISQNTVTNSDLGSNSPPAVIGEGHNTTVMNPVPALNGTVGAPDYTIPGAQINDAILRDCPDQAQPMGSIMNTVMNIPALPLQGPQPPSITSSEAGGSNPAQEKRRQTIAMNRLKRKQAELENELISDGDQCPRRIIRAPKRPDASPGKNTQQEQKKRG